ncbi:hypothetical protein B566_EDAN015174 [Ephemera danica]|nr:hypothetical protein B566_EDAN015174 [Ephemera danica]
MKTAIVFLACVTYVAAQAGCPNIVSRAEWGARPPTATSPMSNPVPYVVIHHSEGASCTTQTSCESVVRGIQDYHMDSNGWNDIGYSFLVGEDGNAYEGRGWSNVGAHAPGYNSNSIGICFLGSFMTRVPNNAALNAGKQLIQCGVSNGYIRSAYSLYGHRQVTATDCPGDALYAEIQTWTNYDPTP